MVMRAYKVKYLWKKRGGYNTLLEKGECLVRAPNLIDAARRGQTEAKRDCKADDDVFVRLHAVKGLGLIRG